MKSVNDFAVHQFMTPIPKTIDVHQTLADAMALMHQLHVRHLPVTDADQVIGVISAREVDIVSLLDAMDDDRTSIEAVMQPEAFTVQRDDSLPKVALEMAKLKVGSAMVMDGDDLVGIFTTVDALRALAELSA